MKAGELKELFIELSGKALSISEIMGKSDLVMSQKMFADYLKILLSVEIIKKW
jgi:hypothetical protein